MRATAWLRANAVEAAWGVFAAANLAAMVAWPSWETIPFHFIWISLTLLYGFRVWRPTATVYVLGAVIVCSGGSILADAFAGIQLWGELFEVPLMSAMFLAMVWHARRRQEALRIAERTAEARRALLARQEQFLQDASHELRTPVTIARGHLELLSRQGEGGAEVAVALDELGRVGAILERLLLLARAGEPSFVAPEPIELEAFLEEVFVRWSEVALRAWRLGRLAVGTLHADPERLRAALDALLENAVKYSEEGALIELRARAAAGEVVIELEDEGCGIVPEALSRIFDRFSRADAARTRAHGGVGLGLAIVDAVAKAHGGRCGAVTSARGSTFSLTLPGFQPEHEPAGRAALGGPWGDLEPRPSGA